MVIFVPLTGILDEMLANQNVQTAAVSMNGQMFCLTESGRALVKEEDLLHGKFARLVMHPEALKNMNVEQSLYNRFFLPDTTNRLFLSVRGDYCD